MSHEIAYIASGTLHLKPSNGPARALSSAFAESARTRATKIHQRNAWKTQGSGAMFQRGGALWGASQAFDPTRIRIALNGVARGRHPGELLYALQTDAVGGLFAQDLSTGEERRLFHSTDRHVRQPAPRSDGALILCSVGSDGGTSHLALMNADGSEVRDVTEGDSVDLAPRWVPNDPARIIYPSAGLRRTEGGLPQGIGPFAIHRLNLKTGEIETLIENDKYDHLAPQMSPEGALYFIRRPHAGISRPHPLRTLQAILLMPLMLLWAVFNWINFFTVRYSGKPLINDGDSRQQAADVQRMMVWGNIIDADAEAKRGFRRGEEAPDLVPKSWELMKRLPSGELQSLAKGVLSFDLADDGTVVFSNGTGVFLLDPQGKQSRVCVEKRIEQVAFVR